MAIAEENTVAMTTNIPADMHPAVQLLLARMATDPEEFTDLNRQRWADLLEECNTYCSAEEHALLAEKYREVRMASVHVKVMKRLTGADEPENDAVMLGVPQPGAVPLAASSPFGLAQSKLEGRLMPTYKETMSELNRQAMQAQPGDWTKADIQAVADKHAQSMARQQATGMGQSPQGLMQQAMNAVGIPDYIQKSLIK